MIGQPFLLSRVLLQFDQESLDLLHNISAIAFTPDGSLWLGSDELRSIERLSPIQPCVYSNHKSFMISDFIPASKSDGEVDIEGLDYNQSYLWFTGSHSTKRNKTKGKKVAKDIQRLTDIQTEPNRYLIGRIPVSNGELQQQCSHPDNPDESLTAAYLQETESGNILIDALREDEHLGAYIANGLPSKENGFDIEGLAVDGNTLFLGLRGPVLRGWALILELHVKETEPGILTLKSFGKNKQPYQKHFFDLDGLGIRELCIDGNDLLILAGPTMDLAGTMRIYRWKHALNVSEASLNSLDSGELKLGFEFPFNSTGDKAEGLALCSCLNNTKGLMVVYDAPDAARQVGDDSLYADIFRWP